MLRVRCPRCQTLLEVQTEARQETIVCGDCGQTFIGIAEEVIREPERVHRIATTGPDLCSVFGFVTVVLGLGLFLCPPVGLLAALIGIVLAVIGLQSQYRGLAVASLMLGSVGLIFSVGFFALYGTAFVVNQEEFGKQAGPPVRPQPRIQMK